jgi:methyl-accepting chemotaxis protein
MRFTVKAKLASAFGVIIALSMVAGGVAYQKLGDMMSTTDTMVLRAKRMERAMEIEKQLLSQVRAEKNAIIGTEAEAAEFAAEALRSRESVLKTKDEV